MSDYQPKRGDRVRVVLEGTAIPDNDVDANFSLMVEGLHGAYYIGHPSEPHVVSVENVAPPLPTTPDSVIRSKILGSVWMLHTDGKWHAADGSTHSIWSQPERFEVIFDAGAAK